MQDSQDARSYRPEIEQDGEGPPLVLVHGTPLDCRCWDGLLPVLGAGLHAIRYDLRGHGTSASCPMAGSFQTLADDLRDVLDRLDIEQAHVAGHSLGGQVAQAFALRHPDRLLSLTVVCARATPFDRFAASAAQLRSGGIEALVEPTLERWFTPAALVEDAPAETHRTVGYARRCLKSVDPEVYAQSLELIAGFDVLAQLESIDVPTRFLAAGRDRVSGPDELRRSCAAIAGAELELFADAGHLLPLEHPREVATLMRRLVED